MNRGESVIIVYLSDTSVAGDAWLEWLPEGSILFGTTWHMDQWAGSVWAALPFPLDSEDAQKAITDKIPSGVNSLKMMGTGAPAINIGRLLDALRGSS